MANKFMEYPMGRAPDPPPTVPVDPGTQEAIDASGARADRSVGQFEAEANESLGGAQVLKQTDQNVAQQAESRAVDPNMLKAIRNQYQSSADQYLDQQKAKNDIQAQIYKGDLLHRQAQMGLSIQGARTQQYKFLADAYSQQEYARAAFVNSLFQTADVGMGMYAGNRSAQQNQAMRQNQNVGGYNKNNFGAYDSAHQDNQNSSNYMDAPDVPPSGQV